MTKKETNKLDKIVSLKVRAKGFCQKCHGKENLQAAHIHSRNARSTRWVLKNLLCLCSKCHFWSHQHPTEFTYWLEKKFGRNNLKKLARLNAKIVKQTYEEVLQELNANST
jgi:5-methylcytosine-specific restriction endonuclease McrA